MMITTLINGLEESSLPVTDRALHYGDGLFETLLVINQKPQNWQQHLRRLFDGCQRLKIKRPCEHTLWNEVLRLCQNQNTNQNLSHKKAVIKIIISRGSGGRGYRPLSLNEAPEPVRIIQLHPYPNYPDAFWQEGITLRMCDTYISSPSVLAGIKHLNRLESVLARSEWDDELIPEGIMKCASGNWVEGTMSNVFLVKNGRIFTPDLTVCGVLGVMRQIILTKAEKLGIPSATQVIDDVFALSADELFVSNSLIGIWPVKEFAGKRYSIGPITSQLSENLIC